MDHMLRKFGFKKVDTKETEARTKLQKDLFAFNKSVDHGFPSKSCCLAFDPQLSLMAIGTKNGILKLYGAPGVYFVGVHIDEPTIRYIMFYNQAWIITVCSDLKMYLWEILLTEGVSHLILSKQISLNERMKGVSACCLSMNDHCLYLGTENSHIYLVDLKSFQQSEQVIYLDHIIQNGPDDFRLNPGAIESIKQHPNEIDKYLIGFNRGLIVLFNMKEKKPVSFWTASQQLESLTFLRNGDKFFSCHVNGSYSTWKTNDQSRPKEVAITPYGPFPCKAINKIQVKTYKNGEQLIVFSGGMPRASYGDRHTLTVMHPNKHTVFDFASKVINFFLICTSDEVHSDQKILYDDPHSLFILTEEELVGVDLLHESWPVYQLPYLCTLHASAITCAHHITNLPPLLASKLSIAGKLQRVESSMRNWPIQGGINLQQDATSQDILITGHEDGSIRFWDVSSIDISLIYKITTSNIFAQTSGMHDVGDLEVDDDWPPFRKIGTYDPFSDDPRLAIQKIGLCALSETLVVAGTAGHILLFQFERVKRSSEMDIIHLDLISDRDNFVWKGHDPLVARTDDLKFESGFQPVCLVQTNPPAACTTLLLHSEWQLLAIGTAHGFGVVDYLQNKVVHYKCTLNPNEVSGVGESTMARRKSFKKSLRESFRRLRSRRSERLRKNLNREESNKQTTGQKTGTTAQTAYIDLDYSRSVERSVEARSTDDVSGSIVRALYFANTFLINIQTISATFWAGTNAGTVFIYQIIMPSSSKRNEEPIQILLTKEINLRHHAPVISISVIDRHGHPLPAPLEVEHERARPPDMTPTHSVIIASEEQLKIFALPNLNAREKFKLTAFEGSKIRKIVFANFRSRSDTGYMESDIICLTNQGDVQIFNIPSLKRQLKTDCIRKDNIIGIVSCVFSASGEGFYLSSPSEFCRFSVSAHTCMQPMCVVRANNNDNITRSPINHAGRLSSPRAKQSTDSSRGASQCSPTSQTQSVTSNELDQNIPNQEERSSVLSSEITDDSIRTHLRDLSLNLTSSFRQNNPTINTLHQN